MKQTRIVLSPRTDNPHGATWCAEKAAYGQGISFSNHHDMFRLIRNANNHIWAAAEGFGGQPQADYLPKYRENTAWALADPWTTPTTP